MFYKAYRGQNTRADWLSIIRYIGHYGLRRGMSNIKTQCECEFENLK